MIDKTMRVLVLLIATIGLLQSGARGAEALPPRALAQIGDHRFYHGPGITCAVLSADARCIASAADYPSHFENITDNERDAYSEILVLWDAATGERLRELRVPQGTIQNLAFSPDGTRLAADYITAEKYGVVVFDVKTGRLLRRLEAFENRVVHLQYSADGKQLRVSEWCGPVSAWDVATGKQLRLWKPPSDAPATKGERSELGIRGVPSADGTVIAWEIGPFRARGMFSSDEMVLHVHDAATDKRLYTKKYLRLRPQGRASFAFSPDGKHFAADCGKPTVWETATGKERTTFDVPDLVGLTLGPDGRYAAIYGEDSRLRVWDVKAGKPSRTLCPVVPITLECHKPLSVFSADGKTLLVATDSTLRLFEVASGKERIVSGHRAAIAPRFSVDGRMLFTSCAERTCRWDVSGKEPVLRAHEPKKAWEIGCLARSADDRLILDCPEPEKRVRLRETATGRILCAMEDDGWLTDSARFSPDATRAMLCEDRNASLTTAPDFCRLHDIKTGKALVVIKQKDAGSEPVYSPNGRIIAWANDVGVIHLYDAIDGKALRTLRSSQALPQGIFAVALLRFSSDGDYLVEGRTLSSLRLFHVSSGREIALIDVNSKMANASPLLSCLTFSPDNRLLAVAEYESGIVRVIEIAGGKVRAEFVGHRHGVHGLAFAPDGKTLASGGEDNVVFLWDVTGAKTLPATEENLPAWWNDLASEDGKRAGLAIASFLRKPEASVAFLQERLHPAKATDEKRLARLLADLDADAYEKRETASRELVRLGERAEDALRRELMNRPSLEVRRRIEDVLSKLEPSPLPPEMLQALRGIEVLEHIGTPAARRCLEALTKGAAEARQTREAKATLRRLTKRRG